MRIGRKKHGEGISLGIGEPGWGVSTGGVTPAINFDFTTGALPGAITFSRASAGTYYNSSGVLTSAAINAARFDYNPVTLVRRGLLIEGSRTNWLTLSNTFTGWSQSGGVAAAAAATSPDGTTNASKVTPIDIAYGEKVIYQLPANTGLSRGSIYVKPAGLNYMTLKMNDVSVGWPIVMFNVATGAVEENVSVIPVEIVAIGNGFYRYIVNYTPAAAHFLIGPHDNSSSSNNTWGPVNTTDGIFTFGAQVEIGASATSYIPTTGSAATRAADVATFNIPEGVSTLRYTFDDNSTQNVTVTPGTTGYPIPTNLNRPWIKTIVSV